jgi:hypothetical protein
LGGESRVTSALPRIGSEIIAKENAMFRKVVLTLPLLLVCHSATGRAEQGTTAERDSCRRDTVRLCKGVAPEDGPMLDCLKTNRQKLSVACRTVLETHGQ